MRAAIVLAAGASRRFGRGDKLLARVGGVSLLARSIANARAAGAHRVIVVVPSAGGRVGRAVRALGMIPVVARDHARGLGASLGTGLAALRPIERETWIFLADMPDARAPRRLRLPPGHDAARPIVDGAPGHPALVRTVAARSAVTHDDRGLISRLHPSRVALVRGSSAQGADVDTVDALRRVHRRWGRRA